MATELPDPTPVPAINVGFVFPEIIPGLEVVRRKTGATWTNSEILDSLVSEQSFLFLAPTGFFILQPKFKREPIVLIWIAYGDGTGQLDHYIPIIETLARQIGATTLVIESPRPGYRRALKGWHRDGETYTRRLM